MRHMRNWLMVGIGGFLVAGAMNIMYARFMYASQFIGTRDYDSTASSFMLIVALFFAGPGAVLIWLGLKNMPEVLT